MSWSSFWKLRSVTGHFLRTPTTTRSIFSKISILFSKQSWCYLPDSYGDPQAEQSTLVMVRQELEWKFDFRAPARSSAEGPSIVVAITASRLRWSMVQERQKHEVSVWLSEVSTLHCPQHQWVLRSLIPRPMSLPFCISFVYVDVQQQVGQAAVQGQRRKAVNHGISGVSHWGVTNLSTPIWFTGQRHCTVFRHVMQLSLLILC